MKSELPSFIYNSESLPLIREAYNKIGVLKLTNFFEKKLIYNFIHEFRSFLIYTSYKSDFSEFPN